MSRRRFVACALAGFLAATGAHGGEGSWQGLDAREIVLDNGVRVILVPTSSPTVSAVWSVGVGSADEPEGSTGVTHLLEHLLFKGTIVVGTRSLTKELALEVRQDDVEADVARGLSRQWTQYRDGKAGDPRDRSSWPKTLRRRDDELDALEAERRAVTALGELSLLYADAGATDLDAATFEDLSLYYVTIPAGRLELWFWLESDRLLAPMLRELRTERKVVEQERRNQLARPEAAFDRDLVAAFWGDDPYGRQVLGSEEDVATVTRLELQTWFEERFRPDSTVLTLVGGFDPEEASRMARLYFGRLPSARDTIVSRPGPPASQPDGRVVVSTADARSRARILYRTVPFGHPDAPALEVLAGLLSGRSGRLYRHLVDGRRMAFAAYAMHRPLRRSGVLTIDLEGLDTTTGADLSVAWELEAEALRRDGVTSEEVDRVANQVAADAYRRLREPAALSRQIAILAQLGDWRQLETWADRIRGVTPADVERVVKAYLTVERSATGLLDRPAIVSLPAPVGRGSEREGGTAGGTLSEGGAR